MAAWPSSWFVPAASCYPAGDLTADLAALAEPVSIGLQAVSRAAVVAGDQVVVLGAGPIGQTAAMAAADRGARVLAVDRLANRLKIAAELGAEVTVNGSAQDVASAVQAWAGPDGPAVVIEATGLPALIRLGVDLVAHSGTVVIVGITTDEVSLPVAEFTRKELNVLGSRNNGWLVRAGSGPGPAPPRPDQPDGLAPVPAGAGGRGDGARSSASGYGQQGPDQCRDVGVSAVVVGGGAMGCLFAGELAASGTDVTVLDAAPQVVTALAARGVQLVRGESVTAVPVRAIADPAQIGAADTVFIFVKAHHTAAVAAQLPGYLRPATTVVSLQNGWGNADVLARVIPADQLVVGVTYHSCTMP